MVLILTKKSVQAGQGRKAKISKVMIYETEDGQTKVQVKIEDETVWLTQARWRSCLKNQNLQLMSISGMFMKKMSCLRKRQWENSEIPNFLPSRQITLMLLFRSVTG